MDDGFGGKFELLYNGTDKPNTFQTFASNLQTGLPYRFKLYSLNINGSSPEGDIMVIYSCLLPSGILPPVKEATTKT
jgi:hypothetical protein